MHRLHMDKFSVLSASSIATECCKSALSTSQGLYPFHLSTLVYLSLCLICCSEFTNGWHPVWPHNYNNHGVSGSREWELKGLDPPLLAESTPPPTF